MRENCGVLGVALVEAKMDLAEVIKGPGGFFFRISWLPWGVAFVDIIAYGAAVVSPGKRSDEACQCSQVDGWIIIPMPTDELTSKYPRMSRTSQPPRESGEDFAHCARFRGK